MRLIQIASRLLVLAAVVIAIVAALADHTREYGGVPVGSGGQIALEQGPARIFYVDPGGVESKATELPAPVRFTVTPAQGGGPLATEMSDGQTSETAIERRTALGSQGAIATFDVPFAGTYNVAVSGGPDQAGARLDFGLDAWTAVKRKSQMLEGLLLAAFLLALIVRLSTRHNPRPLAEDRIERNPYSDVDPSY